MDGGNVATNCYVSNKILTIKQLTFYPPPKNETR